MLNRESPQGWEPQRAEKEKIAERQKQADEELAYELTLLGKLETGECQLEIDNRHQTITIKKADSGEVLFHASIEEYEQLLADREAVDGEPMLEKKVLGGRH